MVLHSEGITQCLRLNENMVLEQVDDDGQHHPIAFASRQTNSAEKKYAPTELEVAALIFAVEHFEVYLLGIPCTVYTDH